MPDLKYCLNSHDSGFLKIIVELWGLDPTYSDPEALIKEIQSNLSDQDLFKEVISALPKDAQAALAFLASQNSVLPWSIFVNKFGDLRDIGPIQRDREKIYRKPISATETLWFRALIGREFLEYHGAVQVCSYIPEEFKAWLSVPAPSKKKPLIPISLSNDWIVSKANDKILDLTCTVLAALRRPDSPKLLKALNPPLPIENLLTLLSALKLTGPDGLPSADSARPFLEMERAQALSLLVSGWKDSDKYNEVMLTPGLRFEGKHFIDPRQVRAKVIEYINALEADEWVAIDDFINWIHEVAPDILRQAGDYDHWLIRSTLTNEPLRGFSSWFEVEGQIIRHLLTGPMHWLGLLDLASSREGELPSLFQKSAWFEALLNDKLPGGLLAENDPIVISSSGLLHMTRHTPRIARYQVSRFGEWDQSPKSDFVYRLSPHSLTAAADQGLTTTHLISLLRKYGKNPPPPSLVKAIKRWQEAGNEASIESLCVLRVSSPEILKQLRESSAGHYLGDSLGPVSVVVKKEGIEKVRTALTRLGYLSDILDG